MSEHIWFKALKMTFRSEFEMLLEFLFDTINATGIFNSTSDEATEGVDDGTDVGNSDVIDSGIVGEVVKGVGICDALVGLCVGTCVGKIDNVEDTVGAMVASNDEGGALNSNANPMAVPVSSQTCFKKFNCPWDGLEPGVESETSIALLVDQL
mmetsp:Transcript_18596/g.28112  ORF Transcript_18596/g.28112 Transcript_18596/m.28112 type:complete len:153 (+) Transcript_18596:3423-3881(+)